MSIYKAAIEEGERSVRMLDLMVLDLRRVMLTAACHRAHLGCADSSASFAHHRRRARALEGEVRRRLHDLSAVAERTAAMLEGTFGASLGGGPRRDEGAD